MSTAPKTIDVTITEDDARQLLLAGGWEESEHDQWVWPPATLIKYRMTTALAITLHEQAWP